MQELPAPKFKPKRYATEYRERTEEIEPEDVTEGKMRTQTLDITYRTNQRTHRTVRCISVFGPTEYNNIPEGFFGFYFEGKHYAYHPTKQRLITIHRSGPNQSIAKGSDIIRIEEITYPKGAVETGAVQEGVKATLYYRSPRSEEMQSVSIDVTRIDGPTIEGTETSSGRRIEALSRYERDIVSCHGTTEISLGKVARVEFPRGHRYVVDVEDLTDGRSEIPVSTIESALGSRLRDESVTVTHVGRIEGQ